MPDILCLYSYNTKLNTYFVFRIENLEWKMENYRCKKAKMRVNPVVSRRGYLKKQTQFSNGQNDVKSILIMVYGVLSGPGRPKNKAKQSQS